MNFVEREKEIVELRYGLKDGKEVTQREIAQRLNISRSYVSRIEKKALKKLKAAYHWVSFYSSEEVVSSWCSVVSLDIEYFSCFFFDML